MRVALIASLLISVDISRASDPFETFNLRFSGTSNALHSVSFGVGNYVAVGEGGTILSSTDTITWIPRGSGITNRLNGVRYGSSGFVAVGQFGTILKSVDGINWVVISSPVTNALSSVGYLSGRYVVVGASGRILTSTDAVSWTSVNSHVPFDLNAVETDSAQFVAVGNSGTILTSADGLAWTPRFSGILDRLTAVAPMYKEFSGRFVAVGESGTILTTRDAATWTIQTSGTLSNLEGVGSDDKGRFSSVGKGGVLITSSGGTNWTTQSSGSSNDLYGVLYANGSFLLVGSAGTVVSGIPWLSRNSGTSEGLSSVCFGDGLFVTVGGQGTILRSSNGTDWSKSASGITTDLLGVCFGGNGFVAVAGANVLVSTNGLQWNTQVLGATNTYFSVAYGNGTYVALGYYYDNHANPVGFAIRSADGRNWTGPYSLANLPNMVTFGSNIFLTPGRSGSLASSPEGISWTNLVSGVAYDLRAAAFGSGTFVAIGQYVTGNGTQLTTSTNGINWTSRNSGYGSYAAIAYGHEGFVASGYGSQFYTFGNVIATSPDGIVWSTRGIDGDIDGPQIASISFSSSTYVAVGSAGTIRQTTPFDAHARPFLRGSVGASGFALSAIAQPGYTYTVKSGGDFSSPWTNFTTFTSTQAETIFLDSTASNRSTGFYRIDGP
jgi:hypothetical protein